MLPRRFALVRHVDYTGVSGVGVVAYGVTFVDGHVVLRWCSTHPATSMWSSVDDLLAIHGHGEATSIEWIDAPHGDLEELPVTSNRGRRARRRAGREPVPTRDEARTGAVAAADTTDPAGIPATRTTDPAGIPAAVTTAAAQPAAAELAVAQAAAVQPARIQPVQPAAVQPAEAEPARDAASAGDDLPMTSDRVRSVTDSATERRGSLHEADPIRAAQDPEPVPAVDDTDSAPKPASKPAPVLPPATQAQTGSASPEPLTRRASPAPDAEPPADRERPSPQSTPGASPDRTDELTATQAWPAWADVTGSAPVARPAATSETRASLPERPAIGHVRQEKPATGPKVDRWAEPRPIQRTEPPSRDDPESTDPFASVLAEEPPEFLGRNNGNRHVDTITGLLDLPADLVNSSRAADSRNADSRSGPAPRQLRRAGRHRRDDD